REKVRRRAFLVRERVKLRVKVKSVLTYEGLKWPSDHGLFTKKGVEWLHELKIDSVESYLRILESLDEEIKLLSKELVGVAEDDEDVKLLMSIPGIGYYTAVLMKSEIGDIKCLLRMLLERVFGMEESLRRGAGGFVGLWLRLLRPTFTSTILPLLERIVG
ncbi:MAG: hypothetical protein ABSE15_08520, partial [Candidatus Bathyarchaeia archaeon]